MSRLLQCRDKNKDAFTCIAAYQWNCINRFIFNDSVALKYVYTSMPETLICVCTIYETTRTICISWRWFSSCKQRLCRQSQSKTFLKWNHNKPHQEAGSSETLPLFLPWCHDNFSFTKVTIHWLFFKPCVFWMFYSPVPMVTTFVRRSSSRTTFHNSYFNI